LTAAATVGARPDYVHTGASWAAGRGLPGVMPAVEPVLTPSPENKSGSAMRDQKVGLAGAFSKWS